MIKYLIDTNVISDFIKGHPNVGRRMHPIPPHKIAISSISHMETEYGLKLLAPAREKKIRILYERFAKMIQILPFDKEDAEIAATIRAQLKKSGRPIGPYDALLAGCAVSMIRSNCVCKSRRLFL